MMTQAIHQLTQPVKHNRPTTTVDDRMRKMIAGAVAEIDPAQIAILRKLTPGERFAQMVSMMRFTENAAAARLHQREPSLGMVAALRIVRSGKMTQWLAKHPQKRKL